MKILITGIYGFLGSHLAKELSKRYDVIGLYNTKKDIEFNRNVSCFNNLELIDTAPDVIIMCHAAVSSGTTYIDNDKLFETNVNFTKQIVEKFQAVKSIYISSVSVFGNNKNVIDEVSVPNPETDYAVTKLLGEKEVNKNPNSVIIRFSSLYGNGMKENTLIPNYCNQALENKSIQVWGDGSRFQNYIHVDDAIRLIEKVTISSSKIEFPILGVTSKEYSNNEVTKLISALTESKIKFVNEDDSPSFHYNSEMTQKIVNWQSEIDLETGLKDYIEWKQK